MPRSIRRPVPACVDGPTDTELAALRASHRLNRIPELDAEAMRALKRGDRVVVLCMGRFFQHCSATGNVAIVKTVGRKYVTVYSQTSGDLRCPLDCDSEWGRRFGLAQAGFTYDLSHEQVLALKAERGIDQ